MNHLHPLFAAALGRTVRVGFSTPMSGRQIVETNLLTLVTGTLGIVVDGDDVPTELAIETDGGATFVRIADVLTIAVEA